MRHVLVVDNQPEIRAVIQMGLEDLGYYRVTAAATGERALALLDADPPDLVVLDTVLPGMPGIELAAHAVHRNVPVLVLTGETTTDERLARLGWPHLSKPFHLDDLLAEVQATITAGRDNARLVRASLERLFRTVGELQRLIGTLDELRGRVRHSVARSRRLDAQVTRLCDVKPKRRSDA